MAGTFDVFLLPALACEIQVSKTGDPSRLKARFLPGGRVECVGSRAIRR
jgi:hypothetical protein